MKRFQEAVPIILWTILVLLICTLSCLKLSRWTGMLQLAGIGMVGCYLFWMVLEVRIAAGEIGRGKTGTDRGTLELYALGRAATVLSALALKDAVHGFWFLKGTGTVLFLAGVWLRLYAIRVLGRFYSHRVRLSAGQPVVSTGPYRLIRHPAYAGMLLAHLGFVLFFFNWVSAWLLLAFFTPAVVLRIRVEEEALLALSGYDEYSRGRKRLLPALW